MKQVYYSKNKTGLWMINEQEGRLRISGADSLCKEDIEVYNPDPNWCDAFQRIEIAAGVTDIYEGFLENIRNLAYLILPKLVTFIETTDDPFTWEERDGALWVDMGIGDDGFVNFSEEEGFLIMFTTRYAKM